MPLSQGHLLLTTRAHHEKISEVTDEEARELGRWLRVLSRVLARVTGVWDWNIVQNNGAWILLVSCFFMLDITYMDCKTEWSWISVEYERKVFVLEDVMPVKGDRLTFIIGAAAAQVVPHVHFHIIPRPALTPELRNRSFTMFGRGQRSELDEDEAEVLAAKLRDELEVELSMGEKVEKGKL